MNPRVSGLKSFENTDPLVKYTIEHSIRQTDVQKKLSEETLKMKMGAMLGAPEVLQLNQNLIRAIGGKKVLDVGVFTGASTLSAALALPEDGEVHALDTSMEFTDIGKRYWEEAGVAHKVHLHIDPASETLQRLIDAGQRETFDFAFIDADKENYDNYYEQCLVLIKSGGIIAFDNTLQSGRVIDAEANRPNIVAIRKLNEKLRDDSRINISFLKIGDGLTLCFKK
ncbi:probable caffeoyl-CoA O-methyltransferase 2 [Macrobrachium nipponense]|uniref:probable caffeoyl-CoA O-methyltransferase 2 n=1 Tax=Macrobrachium nipponense TaxID=159736 RepID=UPI0030C7C521